ncbi:hypothetical protein [Caballeronia sp. ATUFL_F1_KS4A]|uniref:hypothetical protein n=1 Tax=Caballeronia sp. ATUFL_F1_KS4A TaxID=2921768 RepID=UPI00202982C4|nr:hypothetical protein [Caballeronia sp. ATUFL_F1_KS4A]
MADVQSQSSRPAMTTGKGMGIYAVCLVILMVMINLCSHARIVSPFMAILGYLILGFVLNRIVLRGLIEWHPVYNTLSNVSRAKLGMLLFWPLRYPIMFFQLLVSKHL